MAEPRRCGLSVQAGGCEVGGGEIAVTWGVGRRGPEAVRPDVVLVGRTPGEEGHGSIGASVRRVCLAKRVPRSWLGGAGLSLDLVGAVVGVGVDGV